MDPGAVSTKNIRVSQDSGIWIFAILCRPFWALSMTLGNHQAAAIWANSNRFQIVLIDSVCPRTGSGDETKVTQKSFSQASASYAQSAILFDI